MSSSLARYPRHALISKRNPIHLRLDHIIFIGNEEDTVVCLVHLRMARRSRSKRAGAIYTPVAARHLLQLFTSEIVNVVVAEPGALARPQKPLAVGEKIKIVAEVHPVFVRLAQNEEHTSELQ